jgi:hypothetical protein
VVVNSRSGGYLSPPPSLSPFREAEQRLDDNTLGGNMGNRGRSTFLKRQKEQLRDQKKKQKEERKTQRRAETDARPVVEGEDPDIAGIIPGPQPIPED